MQTWDPAFTTLLGTLLVFFIDMARAVSGPSGWGKGECSLGNMQISMIAKIVQTTEGTLPELRVPDSADVTCVNSSTSPDQVEIRIQWSIWETDPSSPNPLTTQPSEQKVTTPVTTPAVEVFIATHSGTDTGTTILSTKADEIQTTTSLYSNLLEKLISPKLLTEVENSFQNIDFQTGIPDMKIAESITLSTPSKYEVSTVTTLDESSTRSYDRSTLTEEDVTGTTEVSEASHTEDSATSTSTEASTYSSDYTSLRPTEISTTETTGATGNTENQDASAPDVITSATGVTTSTTDAHTTIDASISTTESSTTTTDANTSTTEMSTQSTHASTSTTDTGTSFRTSDFSTSSTDFTTSKTDLDSPTTEATTATTDVTAPTDINFFLEKCINLMSGIFNSDTLVESTSITHVTQSTFEVSISPATDNDLLENVLKPKEFLNNLKETPQDVARFCSPYCDSEEDRFNNALENRLTLTLTRSNSLFHVSDVFLKYLLPEEKVHRRVYWKNVNLFPGPLDHNHVCQHVTKLPLNGQTDLILENVQLAAFLPPETYDFPERKADCNKSYEKDEVNEFCQTAEVIMITIGSVAGVLLLGGLVFYLAKLCIRVKRQREARDMLP